MSSNGKGKKLNSSMIHPNTTNSYKQDDLPNCKHLQSKIPMFFSFHHYTKLQN
jgi:hypothetical protein